MALNRRLLLSAPLWAGCLWTDPAKAILFSGAQASGGGGGATTLTTLTLLTTDGSNIAANSPFEFGVPIAPGALVAGQALQVLDAGSNVITVQEDNRHTDLNGNVRFVKLTGLLPSAPGAASTTITLQALTGSPVTSNPITLANLLAQTIGGDTFECLVTCTFPTGTVYTAKATDALNASSSWTYGSAQNRGKFREGPLCTEWICSAPLVTSGTPHPFLTAQFHITAYKALPGAWNNATNPITGVKCTVILENGFAKVSSPADLVYDLLIQVGASTLSTGLQLNGSSPAATLTLGATSGQPTAGLSSGSWALGSTSAPNSQDIGKAIVEVGGNGRGFIQTQNNAAAVYVNIPSTTPFSTTSFTSGNWKKMGVYHYYMGRVSTYFGGHGDPLQIWWGTAQKVVAALPYTYIIASQMVLNYASNKTTAGNPDLTNCNLDGVHPCGMNALGFIKNFEVHEAGTGDEDHIGVMSYSFTAALLNWTFSDGQHLNARKLCFYNSQVGNQKPFFLRDETHGGTISIDSAGCFFLNSISPNPIGISVNDYTGGTQWYVFSTNHSGGASYMPYLMSGDFIHLETAAVASNDYSIRTHLAGIFATTSVTLSNGSPSVTMPSGYLEQTGEAICLHWTGTPQIGGINVSTSNTYFVRTVDATHVNLYDTRAHALAGGATGLITFSSAGAVVFFANGYGRSSSPLAESAGQTRTTAWNARTLTQEVAVFPDTIAAGLVDYSRTKANLQRRLDTFANWLKTNYADNPSYQAGGPRFLDLQVTIGTNHIVFSPWQKNYLRLANLNAYEVGHQNANHTAFMDWFLADAIEWATGTTGLNPYEILYGYYIRAADNSGTPQYTYAGVAQESMRVAIAPNGGVGEFIMAGQSATISSVPNQAAVTIVLANPYFDTVNPSRHIGSWINIGGIINGSASSTTAADFVADVSGSVLNVTHVNSGTVRVGGQVIGAGITAGTFISSAGTGTGGVGTYNLSASFGTITSEGMLQFAGVGQITSVIDNVTCVADATVTTWDGSPTSNSNFMVGAGQPATLSFASWGNIAAIAGTNCNYGNAYQADTHYSWLASSGIEIAMQRGISTADYATARAFMTARGLPSNPMSHAAVQPQVGCPSGLKANVVHR